MPILSPLVFRILSLELLLYLWILLAPKATEVLRNLHRTHTRPENLHQNWNSPQCDSRRLCHIVKFLDSQRAVGGTVLAPEIRHYLWILVAFAVGGIIGVPMALMPMTAVPQRTALSHAFGALAAALVGTAEYYLGED